MAEFKNGALSDALKGRMTKIVILLPEEEGHSDEAQDKELISKTEAEKGVGSPHNKK